MSLPRACLVFAALTLVSASPAMACRCRQTTFPERVGSSPLVVLGRVVRTVGETEIVIVVEEQFKGTKADTLTLRRTDSSCEYFVEMPAVGARHLLLIGTHNGPRTVGECSGSGEVAKREAELGWLRSRSRAV